MSAGGKRLKDWAEEVQALVYQRCGDCGAVWYFRRDFCPSCGSTTVEDRAASGRGTVHAATLVARAPSPELRNAAPYLIILVDAEEGFRLMAHGEPDLRIGDRVQLGYKWFGERIIPYFRRAAA